MSSNENHMISLENYEEWLILYMDNELSADQKAAVDNFLLLHPHLQEELALLQNTKLPAEEMLFDGKENLQAASMKLNVMDESLLLFLDNELSPAEKKKVEERINTEKDLHLQYTLLQKAKLDAADIILHPDKNELYRHTEKVVTLFPVWMRIAVAVIVILFGAYFLLLNPVNISSTPDYAQVEEKPPTQPKLSLPSNSKQETPLSQQQTVAAAPIKALSNQKKKEKAVPVLQQKETVAETLLPAERTEAVAVVQKREAIQIDLSKVNTQTVTALNNSVANLRVTSVVPPSYNQSEDPEEPAVTDGDFKEKRTPAKGFLRKVSRFIERRTGIGTVNADNELLVGAVALKLN